MESSKDKIFPKQERFTRNGRGGGGRNVNGEARRPDHVAYGMELGQMLNLVNKIIEWGFKEQDALIG